MGKGKTRLAITLQLMLAAYGTGAVAVASDEALSVDQLNVAINEAGLEDFKDNSFVIHEKDNEHYNIRFTNESWMPEGSIGKTVAYRFIITDKQGTPVEGLPVTIRGVGPVHKLFAKSHVSEAIEESTTTLYTDHSGSGRFHVQYDPKSVGEYVDFYVDAPEVPELAHVDNIKIVEHFQVLSDGRPEEPAVEVLTTSEEVKGAQQGDLLEIRFVLTDGVDGAPMPETLVTGYFIGKSQDTGAVFHPVGRDSARARTDKDGNGSFFIDLANVEVGTSLSFDMQADNSSSYTRVSGILVYPSDNSGGNGGNGEDEGERSMVCFPVYKS